MALCKVGIPTLRNEMKILTLRRVLILTLRRKCAMHWPQMAGCSFKKRQNLQKPLSANLS